MFNFNYFRLFYFIKILQKYSFIFHLRSEYAWTSSLINNSLKHGLCLFTIKGSDYKLPQHTFEWTGCYLSKLHSHTLSCQSKDSLNC